MVDTYFIYSIYEHRICMNQPKTDFLKLPIILSVTFFLIAAILGLAMRSAFVFDMPEWFNYRNIQHGHSHVALLGWLFGIFYIIIVDTFRLEWSKYSKLFWALQATVFGMLFTFPFIGYASLSIIFSTLHIVLIYLFAYKVWKEPNISDQGQLPKIFLKTSLFFLALSTLGTWALGPIMALGFKGTAVYYASIQFYLHFQFNGWFIFSLLAVVFAIIKSHQIIINDKKGGLLYWTLLSGTVLTYALAISWSTPHIGIFMINSIGVIIQLIALVIFIKILIKIKTPIKKTVTPYIYDILKLSLLALVLKILIQSMVAIPALAEVSYTIRNFVIGFIHLLMLGGLSLFAFGMISKIQARSLNFVGIIFFISGLVLTEILLFVQGLMQWQGWGIMKYYYEMVSAGSLLIVIGLIIILLNLIKKKRDHISL
ncbi:MAG: hypothetical protein ACI9P5_000791 [Saprospiraceae bacterium]|jgi:hypothetical protein